MSKKIFMAPITAATATTSDEKNSSSSSSVRETSSQSDDFQATKVRKLKVETAVAMNYSTLSQTCDRYGIDRVSDRVAAAIASVVLHENNMPIIYKNKLRKVETTYLRNRIFV
ncbi:unnamed protein product [Diatraea saccharalis]|uniref:Uncharacterized protein n=1 Tax=Diatraea saccharalis TaxID=40085 RepID=A0A9N9MZV4_9NEOP|nr:unnamed protein product [Diatraea saccharalis]